MKICLLGNATSPHFIRWVIFFTRRKHAVVVISRHMPSKKIPKVKYIHLKTKILKIRYISYLVWRYLPILLDARVAIKLSRILKNEKCDVLVCHDVSGYGRWGYLSRFRPIVMVAWGSDILRVNKLLITLALRGADLVITHTKYLAKAVMNKGVKRQRVKTYFWNLPDEKIFFKKKSQELRNKLHLKGKTVIFSPRIIKPLYNIETIIKAIPKVVKEKPEVVFVFLVFYPFEDYLNKLKMLAEELGVTERILWLESVEHSKMNDFYNLADIVVSVPSYDGLPCTVMEAFCVGKPVVVSNIPSYKEIINRRNSLMVTPGDEKALARAILRLVKDQRLRTKIMNGVRQTTKEFKDFRQELYKAEQAFLSLAGQRES